MEHIDIKVFSLLMVGTAAIIGAIKKAFPTWTASKEPLLAVAVPVLMVVALKSSGLFKGSEWVDALLWAFGAGMGAGIFHDKAINPLLAGKGDNAGGAK